MQILLKQTHPLVVVYFVIIYFMITFIELLILLLLLQVKSRIIYNNYAFSKIVQISRIKSI